MHVCPTPHLPSKQDYSLTDLYHKLCMLLQYMQSNTPFRFVKIRISIYENLNKILSKHPATFISLNGLIQS